jgi:hypothetical protein
MAATVQRSEGVISILLVLYSLSSHFQDAYVDNKKTGVDGEKALTESTRKFLDIGGLKQVDGVTGNAQLGEQPVLAGPSQLPIASSRRASGGQGVLKSDFTELVAVVSGEMHKGSMFSRKCRMISMATMMNTNY